MHQQTKMRLIAAICAGYSAAISGAAFADGRYLPPSRYGGTSGDLPSPTLLYPERNLPVDYAPPLEPASAPATTVAPPLPIAISPQPTAQNAPPPPAPQPYVVPDLPMLEPASSSTVSAEPPAPALLPPPPDAFRPSAAPHFQSLSTIEMQKGAAPQKPLPAPAPMPSPDLTRQPLASPPPAPALTVPLAPPQAAINVPAETLPSQAEPAAENNPLDAETEAILGRIPSGIGTPAGAGKKTDLQRFDPEIKGVLENNPILTNEDVARHEAMGVAIEVRQPNMDLTVELQNAYEALMGGQPQIALQIYRDILQQMPNHQEALFGMATTYHRTGEPERARPFYIKLLKLYPNHRDGLINFLSLVSEEAPEEAAQRLEFLARKNPDFSAIPALLGIIYDKMGKPEQAIDSMIRAVRMEPENLAYKYNLAVLYDENNMPADAIVLYNQLLTAGRSGLPLPAPMRDLQERVITLHGKPNS